MIERQKSKKPNNPNLKTYKFFLELEA